MSQQHTHNEITKFNRLAPDFWNLDGPFKALHQMNPLRAEFIAKHCPLAKRRILDLGCGGGILSEALAQQQAQVMGIDLSEVGIATAKQHQQLSQSSVDYRLQSSTALISEQQQMKASAFDAGFDAVCCLEMLEHVEVPQAIVNDCAELINDQGWVFFSTLNRTRKAKYLAIYLAEAIGMAPKGAHEHRLFITPAELIGMAQSAGLVARAIAGMSYHPLTQTFSLSHDVDINYIMAFQKAQP